MSDRIIGKPWSPHEDKILIEQVAIHGDVDRWKTICMSIPGRTNKACRKRWLHSLSPSIKKTAWTAAEDEKLLQLYAIYHTKWSVIARQIPGRTDDACSKRYREALDPSLIKDEWTLEEDDKLCGLYTRLGGKWGQIGQELHRSGLGCRNRWRLLQRKRASVPTIELRAAFPNRPSLPGLSPLPQSQQPTSWNPILPQPQPSTSYAGHSTLSDPGPSQSSHSWSPVLDDSPPSYSYEGSPHYHSPPILPSHHPHSNLPPLSGTDESFTSFIPLTPRPQTPPPFQFTSSSLSTALTDPHVSKPLPPVLLNSPHLQYQSGPQPSVSEGFNPCDSPLPESPYGPRSPVYFGGDDVQMSEDTILGPEQRPPISDIRTRPEVHASISDRLDNRVLQEPSNNHHEPNEPSHTTCSTVPTSSSPPHYPRPHDFLPSASTTPIVSPLSLSPPNPSTPIDLPSVNAVPSSSVLFSSHYSTGPKKKRAFVRRRDESNGLPRLDSALPATADPSVRPYACGHEHCWPSQSLTSQACFATSKELTDHNKAVHYDRSSGDKALFRCGLDGCGKSWKSINGLQYHLQISKSHFQHAISSHFSPKSPQNGLGCAMAPTSTSSEDAGSTKELKRKTYPCPKPQCFNNYRQLGGLKYHLMHGHPEDMPVQLADVPPTLARKVAEKLKGKGSES